MGVDVKLKSINIDFIEAQSSTIVLQLDVEKSTFDAQPSSHKNTKVVNMKSKIGKINVKLPLMVGQINNVFIRTSRMMGQQLDDLNSFMLHSNADLIDLDSGIRKSFKTCFHILDKKSKFWPKKNFFFKIFIKYRNLR